MYYVKLGIVIYNNIIVLILVQTSEVGLRRKRDVEEERERER